MNEWLDTIWRGIKAACRRLAETAWGAIEAAYRRPPLLWTVRAFGWLAAPVRRPLQRWIDRRNGVQLRELATMARAAGLADAAARLDTAAAEREHRTRG